MHFNKRELCGSLKGHDLRILEKTILYYHVEIVFTFSDCVVYLVVS